LGCEVVGGERRGGLGREMEGERVGRKGWRYGVVV
jgi:hypothetical protein